MNERTPKRTNKEALTKQVTATSYEIATYVDGAPAGSGKRVAFYDQLALQEAYLRETSPSLPPLTKFDRRTTFNMGHDHDLPAQPQKPVKQELTMVKRAILEHLGTVEGYPEAHEILEEKVAKLSLQVKEVQTLEPSPFNLDISGKKTVEILKTIEKDAFRDKPKGLEDKVKKQAEKAAPIEVIRLEQWANEITQEPPEVTSESGQPTILHDQPKSSLEEDSVENSGLRLIGDIWYSGDRPYKKTWFISDEPVEKESEEQQVYREYNNFIYELGRTVCLLGRKPERFSLESMFSRIKDRTDGKSQERAHDAAIAYLWFKYERAVEEVQTAIEPNEFPSIDAQKAKLWEFYEKMGTLLQRSADQADLDDKSKIKRKVNGDMLKEFGKGASSPQGYLVDLFRETFDVYTPALRREIPET